jgi:O-antigen ligase
LFPFISDRLFLLAPVKDIFSSSPLLGVGLGGFIPSLVGHLPGSFLRPAKIQPVHNLPLLIFLETGLSGLILLSLLIKRNLKKILKPEVLAFLAIIIITGAFDHYWWTLPQNKLILILAWTILL